MRTCAFAFCVWFAVTTLCEAVNVGDTKESVLKEMGRPLGTMKGGGLEILRYAEGEVEIRNGRVESSTLPRRSTPQGSAAPSPPGSVTLQNALILRYTFDEPDGTVHDHSGHGNAANTHGSVFSPDGRCNGAYEFDGRSAFIQTTDAVDLTPPYTVTAWVYLRSRLADGAQFSAYRGRTILARGDLNRSGQWDYIFNVNAYGKLGFVTHSSFSRADRLQNPEVFPLNRWVFVAFTHEEKMGRLYQDGRLVRTRANMNAGDKHRKLGTFIGKIYNTHPASRGDHFWNGKIDELRVYKRALSEHELRAVQHEQPAVAATDLVDTVSRRAPSPAPSQLSPLFHLSFDQGTCADATRHGHDGTGHGVRPVSDAAKGQAMKLDGLTAYVSVERNQGMTLGAGDNRSVSLWWKADLIDELPQALLSMRGTGDGQRGLSVHLFKGKYYRLHLRFYHHADFPVALQAGQWNHLVVAKRGSDWNLFHNGVRLTNPVTRGWPFTQHANADVPLWIGRDHAGDNPFGGCIDEVMFFDRALSENEVKRIYTSKGAAVPAPSARPAQTATAKDVGQTRASGPNVVPHIRKLPAGDTKAVQQVPQLRIGDREATVRQHCGTPVTKHVAEDGGIFKLAFRVGGHDVIAGFLYDRVHLLEYRGREWTDVQIQELLKHNADGHAWTKRVPEEDEIRRGAPPSWIRDDKVIAWYRDKTLTIQSLEWPNEVPALKEVGVEQMKRSPDAQSDGLASIVGKWIAMKQGITHLVEFDSRNRVTLRWIEGGTVNQMRGKYDADYTADAITLRLFELYSDPYHVKPARGSAEVNNGNVLSLKLWGHEGGETPEGTIMFGDLELHLKRANTAMFSRALMQANK